MARMIDADVLKEEIDKEWCPDMAVSEIWHVIDKAPTVVIAKNINAPNNGWISVEDRLPVEKENPLTNDFAEVICFCDFGGLPRRTDIRMYKFGKPSWETKPHFWHGPQNMDGIVTHWMSLPEAPKEVENED